MEKNAFGKNLKLDTYLIIGLNVVRGDFNGRPYHNLSLKCLTPFSEKADSCGINIEVVKLPIVTALNVLNIVCSPDSATASIFGYLLDSTIECQYNKFGQVVGIKILEGGGK